jgi:hypothetical protein
MSWLVDDRDILRSATSPFLKKQTFFPILVVETRQNAVLGHLTNLPIHQLHKIVYCEELGAKRSAKWERSKWKSTLI